MYPIEIIVLACLVSFLLGAMVNSWLTDLGRWLLDHVGEEVHPRELPPVVRAELQDLDQWTGFRQTVRRRDAT